MGIAAILIKNTPILAIFHSPGQGGSTWNLNNTGPEASEVKLSTFFPYKCMGPIQMHTEANLAIKRSNVNVQCMTIILANLVDFLSPMIYAKIQLQGILYSGEEDF